MRTALADAAIALCDAVNYKNAGTVEFVFDNRERKFYFIEMNTRIQVEHPVPEMVTGIDLIKMQLEIASGMPIELRQEDVRIVGHAIECRINAENPDRDFAPSPGKVARYHPPGGFGIRMETHIETGCVIPPFYDSMVGKLVCWGKDRNEAIARILRALDEVVIEGVTTTADFHKMVLNHPKFQSSDFNTAFVGELMEAEKRGA